MTKLRTLEEIWLLEACGIQIPMTKLFINKLIDELLVLFKLVASNIKHAWGREGGREN